MAGPYSLWGELDSLLQDREEAGLLRRVSTWTPRSARCIEAPDGRSLVHFGANDYLALSWEPRVREAACVLPSGRYGAGASPLLTGHTEAHEVLRRRLAAMACSEGALLFSSGYAANVGVVSALAKGEDVVFSDRLNHASLIDGCRLSRARTFIYPHADLEELRALVRRHRGEGRRAWVVTDSVFSMDGDVAPVEKLEALAQEYDLGLIVDEAHATGVYGERGSGLLEERGCRSDRWIKVGTLSKAIGCSGGFVVGPGVLIRYLENAARSFLYSTSLPLGHCRAAAVAVDMLGAMGKERSALRSVSQTLRDRLRDLGHRVGKGDSPIIPIYAPSVRDVVAWSQRLAEGGFYVPAIRPPTVPEGGSLLRVSLNIAHTPGDLDALVDACRF
ncbi:8-amino-7-oxononanoate synthase [Pirellula sp. SH-Sr6A]|uniref:aminotransferase class I/II-fold pyridoxal phosphate-dependent enzyme n=1 Tax=Pirellula sp. SH-Sr6A TaxID=1632865 RepID=UPI00078E7CEC|nr:8-amino-7-oxononanoate synthase [Pirellula sp. SH-Sr6A]AMV34246.1 8-amino-7-oxononanoate synthase [Pirellula sp. SH-Sr6A]